MPKTTPEALKFYELMKKHKGVGIRLPQSEGVRVGIVHRKAEAGDKACWYHEDSKTLPHLYLWYPEGKATLAGGTVIDVPKQLYLVKHFMYGWINLQWGSKKIHGTLNETRACNTRAREVSIFLEKQKNTYRVASLSLNIAYDGTLCVGNSNKSRLYSLLQLRDFFWGSPFEVLGETSEFERMKDSQLKKNLEKLKQGDVRIQFGQPKSPYRGVKFKTITTLPLDSFTSTKGMAIAVAVDQGDKTYCAPGFSHRAKHKSRKMAFEIGERAGDVVKTSFGEVPLLL